MKHRRARGAVWMAFIIGAIVLVSAVGLSLAGSAPSPIDSISDVTPTWSAHLPIIANDYASPWPPLPESPGWKPRVNYYRQMALLPSVPENTTWSHGDWLHARYIVKNDIMQHREDPENPWYTPEGDAAAKASNLAAHRIVDASDEWAVDAWMQAPFHALGILDPQLHRVGYGSYREAIGDYKMGAALDVTRGLGALAPSTSFPIPWPADGTTVPLSYHWGEHPDPLTSCPGYRVPTGLPIILQIGKGNRTPNVVAHAFTEDGVPLQHCVFDETSYTNPNAAEQESVRRCLNARDAIVLVPRDPLIPGSTYAASITYNGETHTWSFTVSDTATAQAFQDRLGMQLGRAPIP